MNITLTSIWIVWSTKWKNNKNYKYYVIAANAASAFGSSLFPEACSGNVCECHRCLSYKYCLLPDKALAMERKAITGEYLFQLGLFQAAKDMNADAHQSFGKSLEMAGWRPPVDKNCRH